jgi:CBS domain-containing protein
VKVRDVMSSPVISVHRDTPFDEVVDLLVENHISQVPVVDEEGSLVGIISEADLIAKEA